MSNMLTYEFVKLEFEKKGFDLLDKCYKNQHQPLMCRCSNGHVGMKSYRLIRGGWGCQKCYGERSRVPYDFIKKEMKKEDCILLSDNYINSNKKLRYICQNGHRHSISWSKWQQGRRCPFCKKNMHGSNIKLNLEHIKCEFEKKGHKVLSVNYVNAHTPLSCICDKGHEFKIAWANFKHNKRGCRACQYEEMSIGRFGEDNPNWKGGLKSEPYCFIWNNNEFKEYIKERDGYRCLNPHCFGTSKKLSVHHINYVKKDCDHMNLITLCVSCNGRANKDREWHTAWYQAILHRRYRYNYE